jgi:hypothetical protein
VKKIKIGMKKREHDERYTERQEMPIVHVNDEARRSEVSIEAVHPPRKRG